MCLDSLQNPNTVLRRVEHNGRKRNHLPNTENTENPVWVSNKFYLLAKGEFRMRIYIPFASSPLMWGSSKFPVAGAAWTHGKAQSRGNRTAKKSSDKTLSPASPISCSFISLFSQQCHYSTNHKVKRKRKNLSFPAFLLSEALLAWDKLITLIHWGNKQPTKQEKKQLLTL